MKQEQDHIKTYSARDIQQYLEGKLSSSEMHAMEKAALDDPFLADAIEGYAVIDSIQQNRDLQSIRTNLEKRLNEEKKKSAIIPIWMRAAIIVLAVTIGGISFYNLFTANTEVHQQPIAKNETVGPVSADTTTTSANIQPKTDSQDVAKTETDFFKKQADNVTVKKPVRSATKPVNPSALSEAAAPEEKEVASAQVTDQPEPRAAKSAVANRSTAIKEGKGELSPMQNDMTSNAFSGKVLDNQNKPVAGATILAKNRTVSTVTDINGFFKISAPDTALNIEVNSLGYQQNNATLRSNNFSNNIILQQADVALEEVVVVGYGTQHKKDLRMQKRDSAKLKAIVEEEAVEPMIGWEKYDSYINSNKRNPSGLLTFDGEVILSFDVNEKHEISNIKIIKSLSQEQDKEAIRLIKEGPQWKTKKGNKAKAKLAIKF